MANMQARLPAGSCPDHPGAAYCVHGGVTTGDPDIPGWEHMTQAEYAAALHAKLYPDALAAAYVRPLTTGPFPEVVDISEVEARHRGHWFSEGARRFFRSRISGSAYRTADRTHAFFVSSEQFEDSRGVRAARRYSVRVADMTTGDVSTFPDHDAFGAYASWRAADRDARRAAGFGV